LSIRDADNFCNFWNINCTGIVNFTSHFAPFISPIPLSCPIFINKLENLYTVTVQFGWHRGQFKYSPTATFGRQLGAHFVSGQLTPWPPVAMPPTFWSQIAHSLKCTKHGGTKQGEGPTAQLCGPTFLNRSSYCALGVILVLQTISPQRTTHF